MTHYWDEYPLPLQLEDTIVSDNFDGNCGEFLETESLGSNLSSDDTCVLQHPTDLTNTLPLLLPLADNGGPTMTHALAQGSPAIDAAGIDCTGNDQRGVARPQDGDGDGIAACDIGAFEQIGSADGDGDGVDDDIDVCPGTSIPESVPTKHLGVNRWALVDDDNTFDTNSPPGGGNGPGVEFTIGDTAGCSCEQIIEAMALGRGHAKFGCSTGVMSQWITAVGGNKLAD